METLESGILISIVLDAYSQNMIELPSLDPALHVPLQGTLTVVKIQI